MIWRDDWRSVWIRPGVLSRISSSTFLTPEWPVGNWDTMIPVSVVQICTCTSVSIRSKFTSHSHLLVNIQITIIPSQVKFSTSLLVSCTVQPTSPRLASGRLKKKSTVPQFLIQTDLRCVPPDPSSVDKPACFPHSCKILKQR